jgi:hypothetical protein
MSQNGNIRPSKNASYTALGLAAGLVFGGFIGLFIGNLIVFTGGGMLLGFAIGTALDNRSKGADA